MANAYHALAFTPAVKTLQERLGSRDGYARLEAGEERNHHLTYREAAFIAARDSFYMATVSKTGWPYMQHRGGPPGFLRVLDERTLGFADFSGNRQYVSLGNLAADDRVSLFLMDYAGRRRLKLFGHARAIGPEDPGTIARLVPDDYGARVERGILIEVAGYDWNCPQHITPRYAEEEVAAVVAKLQARIVALEAERAGRAAGPDPA